MMKKASRQTEDGFERLARLIKEEADDIRRTMATKEDIVELRKELKEHVTVAVDELQEELRPQERSLDKTVLAVADHEARITRIEKRLPTR